jgi:hypothetical protein
MRRLSLREMGPRGPEFRAEHGPPVNYPLELGFD